MCRFLVYMGLRKPTLLANLLTLPPRSIVSQSYDCRLRGSHNFAHTLNGDGFGIGWYVIGDPTPCIYTSITPAWNNRNLWRLSSKITSPLFFAHVRAASPGSPTIENNCHPFQYHNLMWMHNGGIGEFQKIKRLILNSISDELYELLTGTTDSEHCFLLFLQILFDLCKETSITREEENDRIKNPTTLSPYPVELLRKALEETILKLNLFTEQMNIQTASTMNFCITDGQSVVVSRYANFRDSFTATLFYTSGSSFEKDCKGYRMNQNDKRQLCHIVTSEPITDDPCDWIEVPKNYLVVITPQSNLLLYPIPFYAYDSDNNNTTIEPIEKM